MLLSQVLPYSMCKSGNKTVIEQKDAQKISMVMLILYLKFPLFQLGFIILTKFVEYLLLILLSCGT